MASNLRPTVKLRNYVSKLFQPVSIIPKVAQVKRQDVTSKSQRLMLELGIVRQANPGCYHFLPLGVRSLEKLTKIVDKEMHNIGCQKIMFPSLINRKLWEDSGRLDNEVASELFQIKDRHNHNYILSPTHEEVAAELFASVGPLSYKSFPLRLYQITDKYRDEMKPRFGLLRCRQFLMKDLYTFDADLEAAKETYETICGSYQRIFDCIGVPYVKVLGSTGNIGGSLSHEFHFKSDLGEDEIVACKNCDYSANTELVTDNCCPSCKDTDCFTAVSQGIEVGHTFLLGDKYSKPLKAHYITRDHKTGLLQMGSYGLGLSRIIAAAVEVLSSEQEMRWPSAIAPYTCIILPPKLGSKEEKPTLGLAEKLYDILNAIPPFKNDVIIDDRTSLTIGKRFLEAKRLGYPFVIAIGQKAAEDPPQFEINNIKKDERAYLSELEVVVYLRENACS